MRPDPQSLDIESVYAKAVEFSDLAARDEYLQETCRHDEQLKRRVERLLAAHDQRGDFLSSRGVAPTAVFADIIEERLGAHVGPYKLLEEIGEGGMGVVYMAEQAQPVRRRVALKIIKPGMDTRQVVARFEAERQALALMDHPNIARVLDAGATESGRPFFVMELVRGMTITEYCDRERLPIRDRLELFILVCRAVQHAHQKGIIHRDLKPSNVMVTIIDGLAVPKIIDFGVAKATGMALTERTLVTGFHQFIGTPLYMSPEQADLSGVDVDTRSDVYALGVLLYELLTGTTPIEESTFREAPFEEIRRIFREVEPPRPSVRVSTLDQARLSTMSDNRRAEPKQLSLSMREELDWIVMKALEKDRQRRYETASDLAADVSRYLNDEPVVACPPSRRYQLEKLARRHRTALVTTSAVMAALLVGAGIAVWQAVRATHAEHAKDAALQQARRAVDEMYTKVAEKWLANQGDLSPVQREFLGNALQFYESFSRHMGDDPEVRHQSLRAAFRVVQINLALGKTVEAEIASVNALAVTQNLVREYPVRADFREERLRARCFLMDIFRISDRMHEFNQQIDAAAAEMAQFNAQRLQTSQELARSSRLFSALGSQFSSIRRFEAADAAFRAARQTAQSLVKKYPTNFEGRRALAAANVNFANHQLTWDRADAKVEILLRESETNLAALLRERPDDRETRYCYLQVLSILSKHLSDSGRHDEAADASRRIVAALEQYAREFRDDWRIAIGLSQQLHTLGAYLNKADPSQEMSQESLQLYRGAHAIAVDLLERFPTILDVKFRYLESLQVLSTALYLQGQFEETAQINRSTPQLLAELAAENRDNPVVASVIANLIRWQMFIFVHVGDHRSAATAAGSVPLGVFRPTIPDVNGQGIPAVDLNPEDPTAHTMRAHVLLLMAAWLDKCAALAEHDSALSQRERKQAIDRYAAQAEPFRGDAERELTAYVRAVQRNADPGWSIGAHIEQNIADHAKALSNQLPWPLSTERPAVLTAKAERVRRLAHLVDKLLADDPSQVYVAAALAAAPTEFRDDDLNLRLARRGVELNDSEPADAEFARQTLGWAFFRASKWQACLDAIPKPNDPENDAIVSMALWQLGRRDEALARFAGAERRLKALEQVQNGQKDRNYAPSSSMLWRLHDEAVEMLDLGSRRLGDALAVQGNYDEARKHYQRLAEAAPDDHQILVRAALLQLASGNRPGYETICRKMLNQFDGTNDAAAARRTCNACALSSSPVGDLDQLVRLADVGAAGNTDPHLGARERGLVAYRAGDWDGALRWSARSRELDKRKSNVSKIIPMYIEAMALHQLGKHAEAEAHFDHAVKMAPESLPGADWIEWVYYQQLRSEAEALLQVR